MMNIIEEQDVGNKKYYLFISWNVSSSHHQIELCRSEDLYLTLRKFIILLCLCHKMLTVGLGGCLVDGFVQ